MTLPEQRKVATRGGDGVIRLAQEPMPALKKGTVLVKVRASLVSPGTELNGWVAYSERRNNPDPTEKHSPFGYSNGGIVEAVGEGIADFKKGDRVAGIGWGYALHADYTLIPHHLCIPLPDNVTFDQGAYAMLIATALHALRRGEPEFGENVCVVGLGIVGLLTARLYQLAGSYVIGWDKIPFRLEIAKKFGIEAVAGGGNEVELTKKFTNDRGLDAAVLANTGSCDETVSRLVDCMKITLDGHAMGKIMVVGRPVFSYDGKIGGTNNLDIRRCARTGFGYHDPDWEHGGDYPPVAMRWTTRTNLALCMRLIAEGKVNVDLLTTHRIPLERVEEETGRAMKKPETMLGVIFNPA